MQTGSPNNTKLGNDFSGNGINIAAKHNAVLIGYKPIEHISAKAEEGSPYVLESVRARQPCCWGAYCDCLLRLISLTPTTRGLKMATQFSQQNQISDSYRLSCQISFLAEAAAAWAREMASSGISQHSEEAAYGFEIIANRIASEVQSLSAGASEKVGQGND